MASAAAGFQFSRALPPADLRLIVRDVWSLRGAVSGAVEAEPVLPDGYPEIVFNRGDPFVRTVGRGGWELQPRMLLVGPQTKAAWIRPTGVVDLVGVRLQPWALGLVARSPAHELRDSLPALGQLAGPQVAAFGEGDDLIERICRWLRRRQLEAPPRVEASLTRVAGIVDQLHGDRRGRLVSAEGMSSRQVERLFRYHVGLSRRSWRAIRSFQAAVSLKARNPRWTWGRVAAATGYVDQAHLVREFRGYAGITPGQYREDRLPLGSCFLDLDRPG